MPANRWCTETSKRRHHTTMNSRGGALGDRAKRAARRLSCPVPSHSRPCEREPQSQETPTVRTPVALTCKKQAAHSHRRGRLSPSSSQRTAHSTAARAQHLIAPPGFPRAGPHISSTPHFGRSADRAPQQASSPIPSRMHATCLCPPGTAVPAEHTPPHPPTQPSPRRCVTSTPARPAAPGTVRTKRRLSPPEAHTCSPRLPSNPNPNQHSPPCGKLSPKC